MKTFFFILLLLIALAGLVFYVGLVRVEPGTAVLLHSHLSGLQTPPLVSGKLHWCWQRLVPGDATLYTFPSAAQDVSQRIPFLLPPGELPGLERKDDFQVTVGVNYRLQLSPDAMVSLVKAGIKQYSVLTNELYSRLQRKTVHLLSLETATAIKEDRAPALAELFNEERTTALQREISSLLDSHGVRLDNFRVSWLNLPDLVNYMRLREIMKQAAPTLAAQIRSYYEFKSRLAREKSLAGQEQARLESMGKLIKRYPRLLQYLAIQRISDKLRIAVLSPGSGQFMLGKMYREMLDRVLKQLEKGTAAPETTPPAHSASNIQPAPKKEQQG